MNTTDQGRMGEAAAVVELIRQGYEVFHPLFGNTSCDLVAIKDGVPLRVECKSSRKLSPSGNAVVFSLVSTRHNLKTVVRNVFDAGKSDLLALYLVPIDKVVLFNSADYHGPSYIQPHLSKFTGDVTERPMVLPC